jgi:hypothetical protein
MGKKDSYVVIATFVSSGVAEVKFCNTPIDIPPLFKSTIWQIFSLFAQ